MNMTLGLSALGFDLSNLSCRCHGFEAPLDSCYREATAMAVRECVAIGIWWQLTPPNTTCHLPSVKEKIIKIRLAITKVGLRDTKML